MFNTLNLARLKIVAIVIALITGIVLYKTHFDKHHWDDDDDDDDDRPKRRKPRTPSRNKRDQGVPWD